MAPAPAFPDTVLRETKRSPSGHIIRNGSVRAAGDTSDFKLHELTMLSVTPLLRRVHHWWLMRTERHYLICADVEQQRAREAQMNVAYYQKRAALARASRY